MLGSSSRNREHRHNIAGYLAGGYDAAVPAQRNRAQDLARLDRRTVLKLCAASLSAAALGTGLSSCASGPDKRGQVVFKEVTRAQLKTAAGDIARTLLGFLEHETSNEAALQQMDRVLREAGVWQSVLAGPVAPVNQVGTA
jgi:hypothetical protein